MSVAEIARVAGVCRDTVYKYLRLDDLSPKMPAKGKGKSKLDKYRPLIESWLDEDRQCWRKQRHTARKIWSRLTEEEGAKVSEARVRQYMAMLRRERGIAYDQQFLDLDWAPGVAQADFGEADFYVLGVRTRPSFFVLSFPFSNVGVAQVFASENAECVCQGLKDMFEFLSGVPSRIVFDNATGVGRRVCGEVSTTETFQALAAHYGFDFRFCNPDSGHEKSNVENLCARAHRFSYGPSDAMCRAERLGVERVRLGGPGVQVLRHAVQVVVLPHRRPARRLARPRGQVVDHLVQRVFRLLEVLYFLYNHLLEHPALPSSAP